MILVPVNASFLKLAFKIANNHDIMAKKKFIIE